VARVSAQEYADKWGRRLKQASEDVRKGIERVKEAPGKAAAAAKDLMLSKVTAAVNDGTWARQVAGVTLEDWKKSATEKGVARIAQGVDSALPKQPMMAEKLLAAVDASVAEANATPRGDLEANITRMTTFVRGMSKRKLRRP
jgi:hypothetical protein